MIFNKVIFAGIAAILMGAYLMLYTDTHRVEAEVSTAQLNNCDNNIRILKDEDIHPVTAFGGMGGKGATQQSQC